MLLNEHQINQALEDQYGSLGRKLPALVRSSISHRDAAVIEDVLGVRLPESFRRGLTRFDLSSLDLGAVGFKYGVNYETFRHRNLPSTAPWWGEGDRPANRLLIAMTTAYGVLLEVLNGNVLAYPLSQGPSKSVIISRDFESFVLGAGTVAVQKSISDVSHYAIGIADAVGADPRSPFWQQLCAGAA